MALLALSAVGCTHTRLVDLTVAQGRNLVNERAAGRSAAIMLPGGHRETAREFRADADSASWIDAAGQVRSVPLADVRHIRVANRRRGALEGLGIGAGIGAVAGVLGVLEGGYLSNRPIGLIAAGMAVGAEIGVLVGLVTGRTRFVPTLRNVENGGGVLRETP